MSIYFRINIFIIVTFLFFANFVAAEENIPSFAVLELFTSEGCSSCPPADRLLSSMVAQSHKSNARIFPLEFHVDYWDYLGWRDPYSKADFSKRQRRYAQALESSSVYTPHMVINGKVGFGGYRQDKMRTHIKEALQTPGGIRVDLSLVDLNEQSATVSCDLSDINRHANLHVALIEQGISSDVPRGENAGRLLKHDNVVRVFKTILIDDFMHQAKLDLPQNLKIENASVVAYVQDRKNMHILGVSKIALSPSK